MNVIIIQKHLLKHFTKFLIEISLDILRLKNVWLRNQNWIGKIGRNEVFDKFPNCCQGYLLNHLGNWINIFTIFSNYTQLLLQFFYYLIKCNEFNVSLQDMYKSRSSSATLSVFKIIVVRYNAFYQILSNRFRSSYHLHRSSLQKTSGNSVAETSRSQLIATKFKDVFDELMNQWFWRCPLRLR